MATYKNSSLNPVWNRHCEHIKVLDKVIDFFSESDTDFFRGVDRSGDIYLGSDDVSAFIRVDMWHPEPLICLNFILADYEDFKMEFFIGKCYWNIPINAPKELMPFIDLMGNLREFLNNAEGL